MELSRLISLIWLLSGGGAEQGKEPGSRVLREETGEVSKSDLTVL